jgi:hypothetical protein
MYSRCVYNLQALVIFTGSHSLQEVFLDTYYIILIEIAPEPSTDNKQITISQKSFFN